MSIFDFLSSSPELTNPQTPSLMDHLLSMNSMSGDPTPATQSPLQSQPISAPTLAQATPNVPDLWQPTHRNIIGKIADAIIMAHGGKPVYEQRMRDKDLTSAMGNYDPEHPQAFMQRLGQIPGMAPEALKMGEQYVTDQDRQESRAVRDAAKKDLLRQRLGGIAGVTTPDNFDKSRSLMLSYVKSWGEDPADYNIPDSYDKDALDVMSGGTITAKDQQAEQARQQALELRGQAQDNTQSYRERRLGQIDTAEGDRNDRFNEGQDRTDRRHDNPVARPRAAPYVGKIVKTPQGDMELSPSGLTGKIGDDIWQKTNGNQWVKIGKAK